jgi:uncharacterized protein YjbI with pentapeptide repeats
MESRSDIKITAGDSQPELKFRDVSGQLSDNIASTQVNLRNLLLQGPTSEKDAVNIFIALTEELMKKEGTASETLMASAENILISRLEPISVSIGTYRVESIDGDKLRVHRPGCPDDSMICRIGFWLFESVTAQALPDANLRTMEAFSSSISPELFKVVARCLEPEIRRRYETVAHVRDALIDVRDACKKARPKVEGLDTWTKTRIILWVILGLLAALWLLHEPRTREFTTYLPFPIQIEDRPLNATYYWISDADAERVHGINKELSKQDLFRYPPDALVSDIIDRRTGRVIYHSDKPLKRAMLLHKAIQSRVSLRGADLHHIHVETGVRAEDEFRNPPEYHPHFDAEYLPQFTLKDVDLRDALICGCSFYGVDFSDCDLRGATVRGAGLGPTSLYGSHFEGSNLAGVRFTGNLSNASFDHANLKQVTFAGCGLNVSFRNCKMKIVEFKRGTVFEDCDFTAANICHGDFTCVDLRNSKFCNATLFRCALAGAAVSGVNHDGSFISGCQRTRYDQALKDWSNSPVGWVLVHDYNPKPDWEVPLLTANQMRILLERQKSRRAPISKTHDISNR